MSKYELIAYPSIVLYSKQDYRLERGIYDNTTFKKWKSSDRDQIQSYRNAFFEEGNRDCIEGATGLIECKTIENWFHMLENNELEETLPNGLVPATIYVFERLADKKIVGILNTRHYLNDYLLNYGGHIGYRMRKRERRKGYAKEMLRKALEQCRKLAFYEVLVTTINQMLPVAKQFAQTTLS